MATLVLTAVGSAIGGPIGGAIGGLIGNAVDRTVLPTPGRREGPRLTQLAVQTSSYGTQIPKLFGGLRVAGTVIWSTDLIESRATSGTGKGQPTVTTYSYAASFAVLLSARPIVGIGRIWADGNLLRGAAGDFKASTGFRLHLGDEDQAVDPLIASAVGIDHAPAHRGCAYAVFENLQLAGFGNRIPSLTFEVIADAGPVAVRTIAEALAPEVTSDASLPLGGFAVSGGSIGAVLRTLAGAGGGWFVPEGDGVVLRTDPAIDASLADDGVSVGAKPGRRTRSIAAIESVPRVLSLSYYDPDRDYQLGSQQVRRPGAGDMEQRVEMPAVMPAGAAKTMAAAMLSRAETERTTRTVSMALDALAVRPGDCVGIAGESGGWRVTDSSVEGYVVTLTLVPLAPATMAIGATGGSVVAAPDAVIGTTRLVAFEVPALDDELLTVPRLTIAAAGMGAGWRRAALLVSTDRGGSWTPAGSTAAPATIGTLTALPGAAPSTLFDLVGSVEVELLRSDLVLEDADDTRLDAGANLALAGDELIQFGRAVPLGGGRWQLGRLLRGRRGTEAAIAIQAVGDPFVLLDRDSLRTIDLPLAAVGSEVRVMASGVGDTDGPVEATVAITGRSIVPPSPAHLTVAPGPDDTVRLGWTRRSRAGWRWTDGIDAPLAEESEAYRVDIAAADGSRREVEAVEPAVTLGAAERAGTVVAARQLGSRGWSAAATLQIDEGA
jgi:hypothetical protein